MRYGHSCICILLVYDLVKMPLGFTPRNNKKYCLVQFLANKVNRQIGFKYSSAFNNKYDALKRPYIRNHTDKSDKWEKICIRKYIILHYIVFDI